MGTIKTTLALSAAALLTASSVHAIKTDKIDLKGNMTLQYLKTPGKVDNLGGMFTEGMVYGRLRMNTFYWDWNSEGSNQDNKAMGVGGSLVYKTAQFSGLRATLGMYTTQSPEFFREDDADVGIVKAGKDTFNRNKVYTGGHFGLTTVAQAYLQYDRGNTSVIAGRQMFESVFTKSNDTKMIPNTFDGISVTNKDLPDTKLRFAYFTAQKLRDHTDAHDVIAYGDTNGDGKAWDENDDSAVNKSLTPALIGTNNELIIATATNKSVKNLRADVSYMTVPDVVSNLTLEAHYKIPLSGGWSVAPGFRYMHQMDELGTTASVANLKGNTTGYTDADSLDGGLFAGRVDFKQGPMMIRLGYSKIEDEADILAMWRGFPTGGFSRAMAQYNWYANTKTSMLRFDYDFGKAGMVEGFKLLSRYAIQDFDDSKPGVQADSDVVHIDMTKVLNKQTEMKIRLAFVDGDTGSGKTDIGYNEYRLEFNYFF